MTGVVAEKAEANAEAIQATIQEVKRKWNLLRKSSLTAYRLGKPQKTIK